MPVSPRAGYAESQRVAFCATCKANTSSVSVCPFCGQDIDADGDQMCQTCQDRVAPLLVCHQCGEHREAQTTAGDDHPTYPACPICRSPVTIDPRFRETYCAVCDRMVTPTDLLDQPDDRTIKTPVCHVCHDPILSGPVSQDGIYPLHAVCALRVKIATTMQGVVPSLLAYYEDRREEVPADAEARYQRHPTPLEF